MHTHKHKPTHPYSPSLSKVKHHSYLGYEAVHVELVRAGKEVEGASHQRIRAHRTLVFRLHQRVPATHSIVR